MGKRIAWIAGVSAAVFILLTVVVQRVPFVRNLIYGTTDGK